MFGFLRVLALLKEVLVFLGDLKVKTLIYWGVRREELVCTCWPSGEVMVHVYVWFKCKWNLSGSNIFS